MSFDEKELENMIVELIKNKGYDYVHGDYLNKTNEEVILEEDLKTN